MIYGLNFNGTHIPPAIAKKFAKRMVRTSTGWRSVSANQGCEVMLQGVCQTEAEYQQMRIQANNGRRNIVKIERDGYIGVFCG